MDYGLIAIIGVAVLTIIVIFYSINKLSGE